MVLDTLETSLLGNLLIGEGTIKRSDRWRSDTIRACQNFNVATSFD